MGLTDPTRMGQVSWIDLVNKVTYAPILRYLPSLASTLQVQAATILASPELFIVQNPAPVVSDFAISFALVRIEFVVMHMCHILRAGALKFVIRHTSRGKILLGRGVIMQQHSFFDTHRS